LHFEKITPEHQKHDAKKYRKNIEKHFKNIARNALKINTLKIPPKALENRPKTIDFRAQRARNTLKNPKSCRKNVFFRGYEF